MADTYLKHYGSDSVPLEQNLKTKRGDGNRYFTFAHAFLASEIVSAEFTAVNSSGTTKINLHSDVEGTQFDYGTNYVCTLKLKPTDTSSLTGSDLSLTYDIEFIINGDGGITDDTIPVTVAEGSFTVSADITT